jgi:hypothetical protein
MLQAEELNYFDVSQRINTLLALEEQRNFSLENLKRQQIVKKYFNKRAKTVEFKIDDKVLLWDSTHTERGRHSKFQKLWLGPFKIVLILSTNSYLLKDMDERLFSYSTFETMNLLFPFETLCGIPRKYHRRSTCLRDKATIKLIHANSG